MKRRVKLEKLTALLCIADILVGMVLASGLLEGQFRTSSLTMFTSVNAIWALIYYVLELRYLKVGGQGFLSTGLRFTILINATGMAMISLIYLGPMYTSIVGPDYLALVLLEYVLPILIVLDYLVGPKHRFKKKHILYTMIFVLVYNCFAIGLGLLGYGIGLNGAQYPYPFLHIGQLGWVIVLVNVGMLMVVQYLYGWLWVKMDQRRIRNGQRNY